MFEQDKIHIFWRGTNMMFALPQSMVSGEDAETKRDVAAILSMKSTKGIIANHKYHELPEGWLCYRIPEGKIPTMPKNGGFLLRGPTGAAASLDNFVIVRDLPPDDAAEPVTPRAKQTAAPAPQMPQGMVMVDAEQMTKLIAHVTGQSATILRMAEEIAAMRLEMTARSRTKV